ncbi:MAG: alpha/beta hydrolase family esterase [Burkholderiales bacterium]
MSRTFVTILRTIALAVGALFILLRGPAAQSQVRDVISFDGDNRAQLLIRSGTAATQLGRFDTATQRFNFFAATDPGTSFRYVAAVDLNGDGRSDLVYQNITQGQAGDVAALDGIKPNTSTVLRSVKRTWDVQAVGDLDGDGFGDLVWRYVVSGSPDTGVSYVWFTNGSSVTQVRKRGGAPLDWKLIGARDINGDHAADMVYVSPDNRIRVLMAAAQRTCANLPAGSVSPGFTAVRLADFEGTGRASLLTRSADGAQLELISLDGRGVPLPPPSANPDDPNAACASSNSSIITSKTRLPTVNPAWQLVGADDYDGDGIADLVWMQPDGSLTFWKMNGTASPRVSANVGTIPAGFESYANAIAAVPSSYPVGISDQAMMVDGTNRNYRVYVPNSITAMRAIVLVLHGGGGEGLGVADIGTHPLSVFRTVADREGFVVVYPGGLPAKDIEGRPGWVDCRADNTTSSGADDVGFLVALVERVRTEYGMTTSRMFMTGTSNGAQMTHAFSFNRADLVAAVATASGSLPVNPKPGPCTTGPSRPLPILVLHGTSDTQMPWLGGCVANVGSACNRGRVISAEATRDRWLQINGLSGVNPSQTVLDGSKTDAGPANRFDYAGTIPLRWWRLDGAGHTVASQTVIVSPNPLTGIQNRDIEFAEVAWAFFAPRLPANR